MTHTRSMGVADGARASGESLPSTDSALREPTRGSLRLSAMLRFLRRLFFGQSEEDAHKEYVRTHPKPLHLMARAEARRSREARKAQLHARQALRNRGGDAA